MKRPLLELAIVLTVAALAVGALALTQRRFIYFPQPSAVPSLETIFAAAEEVTFTAEDGLALAGWFVPAERGGRSPAVLVCNGNAGDRSHRAPLAKALASAGFAVLLFDYRGYGGNPGSPTERGLIADARAAARYLASRDDVDATRIAYFGESLGAAVAIALAGEIRPEALVLRSPFTSLADLRRLHYPLLPLDFLLLDRYPALEQIRQVASPLLVLAGERDEIVPPEHSRRLFDAANEPKRFVVIPAAHHTDPALLAGADLVREVVGFLTSAGEARRR